MGCDSLPTETTTPQHAKSLLESVRNDRGVSDEIQVSNVLRPSNELSIASDSNHLQTVRG